ncbi:hypothetical protein [Spirosoma spitsbergense]|uniref:hypothetical protein n=1 Tax=Spirosoma spitsbergense TaxID=431554 RepID=UPI0012F71169|nr:hypothetical protein [Spirosoma spitsbergense]
MPLVVVSQNRLSPQQRFEKLARKMRLKTPKLAKNDCEIRIWNQQGLRFGDAQMLYVLSKKKKLLSAAKYVINSDEDGFKRAVRLKPTIPITTDFWEQLLHRNILTLPDQGSIHDKLFPRPPKDSTWTSVDADGSVSVHAKRNRNNNVLISDGESYYFEVFSVNEYRIYSFSNPELYIRYKPNIAELQNVVAILNELATLFHSTN